MISPVVAKMALERGLPTGRTIGNIYAWGAAGSIAGTFAAGYWLIATFGTITIIWTIGASLLLMSILYWTKFVPLYIWAVVFTCLMTMAMIPAKWAQQYSSSIALRAQPDPSLLYEDESRYYRIVIRRDDDNPHKRLFFQDTLKHSEILMNDIYDLQYYYEKIYAAITEGLAKNKSKLSVMAIGGGGYVFPRYIEKFWPGSRIDVAEIDPAVTTAAIKAFGLQENTTINTINMDARNYVDGLLEQKRMGREIPKYDFVYGDAFNDYSVPFQLVTQEFDEKISEILSDDGVYMINVVDIFDSGLFLGSVVNTLKSTFGYVYVVSENAPRLDRNTFVIVAAKNKLDLKNIISQYKGEKLKLWYLDDSDISKLEGKSRHLVLTDDYSPVENLLAPTVLASANGDLFRRYFALAEEFKAKGQFTKSIETYYLVIKTDPITSITSYNEIGIMYFAMGDLEQAVKAFNKAIEYNEKADYKVSVATIHSRMGLVLMKLGKQEQAVEQFRQAVQGFREEIAERPAHHQSWNNLGNTLAIAGNMNGAIEAFKQAILLNPDESEYYFNLARVLEFNEQYGQAIEVLKKCIELMQKHKQYQAVSELQSYLESLEHKK
jgi:tetratricopeptide (TPR) repeat protein